MNRLHPELAAAVKAAFDFRPMMAGLPLGDIEGRRASVLQGTGVPRVDYPDVVREVAWTTAPDGAEIELRVYAALRDADAGASAPQGPMGGPPPLPEEQDDGVGLRLEGPTHGAALVYIHGGGLIVGSLDTGEPRALAIAAATGLTVVAMEYRLAPEHPYPIPLEDCYAALVWTRDNAERLGVDPTRIGIGGESAGAGLAAGVALLARDRGGPTVAAAYLGCPMLDPTTITEPPGGLAWYTWSHVDNETGWRAYLPDVPTLADASGYAAPAFAERLEGFPPTYIDVGTLDLFCAEDIAFAARLLAAGVPCELHVIPGAPHGFVALAPDAPVSRRINEARNAFLTSW